MQREQLCIDTGRVSKENKLLHSVHDSVRINGVVEMHKTAIALSFNWPMKKFICATRFFHRCVLSIVSFTEVLSLENGTADFCG